MSSPILPESAHPESPPSTHDIPSPPSRPKNEGNVQEIAREALKAYSRACGVDSETPSVESIIAAYRREGQGDRSLLLAILEAKQAEDERLMIRDQLQLAKLRAQSAPWPQLTMAPSNPIYSKAEVSDRVAAKSPNVEPRKTLTRKNLLSSSSCGSLRRSPKMIKRPRPCNDLPPGHEKPTREEVRIALEAKIARTQRSHLYPPPASTSSNPPGPSLHLTNQPRPSLKLATGKVPLQLTPCLGVIRRPYNPQPSPCLASATTQASSYSSRNSSAPSSPSFSPSSELITPACNDGPPGHSGLRSSLARLLNDDDLPLPHCCQ